MNEAELVLFFAKSWSVVGVIVALAFLVFGIDRFDEDARGAYIFRPLLVPGVVLIWPLVLWLWFILETGRDNWPKRHMPVRNIHQVTAFVFGALIISILVLGLAIRQSPPTEFTPQKLTSLGALIT